MNSVLVIAVAAVAVLQLIRGDAEQFNNIYSPSGAAGRLDQPFIPRIRNYIQQSFLVHEIVPSVVRVAPLEEIQVRYRSGVHSALGNVLTPRSVKDQPHVLWRADPRGLYTLCLTDPDVPSRQDKKDGELKHWLVVNIPGDLVEQGQVLAEYIGSGPPLGTGLHCYIFLAYRQSGRIVSSEFISKYSAVGRFNFNITQFAQQHRLGNPVAGNFYQAQWDDYVPELYAQLNITM